MRSHRGVFSGRVSSDLWPLFYPFLCSVEARSGIFRRSSLDTRLVVVFAVIFRSNRCSPRPRQSSLSRRVTSKRQGIVSLVSA
jgi:hypothetical protein